MVRTRRTFRRRITRRRKGGGNKDTTSKKKRTWGQFTNEYRLPISLSAGMLYKIMSEETPFEKAIFEKASAEGSQKMQKMYEDAFKKLRSLPPEKFKEFAEHFFPGEDFSQYYQPVHSGGGQSQPETAPLAADPKPITLEDLQYIFSKNINNKSQAEIVKEANLLLLKELGHIVGLPLLFAVIGHELGTISKVGTNGVKFFYDKHSEMKKQVAALRAEYIKKLRAANK